MIEPDTGKDPVPHSDRQNDLRERVENAITAACNEWALSAYDVVGVLEAIKDALLHKCVVDCEDEEDGDEEA